MKKKSKYEYLLWNAYHTVIVILLAGLLIVEVAEYFTNTKCGQMLCWSGFQFGVCGS